MKNNKKGFTLIELLVVIAIIGLLATLSVVALNNARLKSRDAKRVSDIKQIQTALELYFVDVNGYPSVGTAAALGVVGGNYVKLSAGGFSAAAGGSGTVYMGQVPAAPTPPANGAYTYCSTTSAVPATCTASTESYKIVFGLEGATGGLTCGTYGVSCCTATPNGITCT